MLRKPKRIELTGSFDWVRGNFQTYGKYVDMIDVMCDFLFSKTMKLTMSDDELKHLIRVTTVEKNGIFVNGNYKKEYENTFLGMKFYSHELIEYIDGIAVFSEQINKCFIDMSGKAVREYIQFTQDTSMRAFLKNIVDKFEFKPTRVDACIDDFVGVVPLRQLAEKVSMRHFKGLFRNYKVVGSEDDGLTVYLGSRQSLCMLRIYDKKAEIESKIFEFSAKELERRKDYNDFLATNNVVHFAELSTQQKRNFIMSDDELDDTVSANFDIDIFDISTWTRYELELKDTQALLFIYTYLGYTTLEENQFHVDNAIEYQDYPIGMLVRDWISSRLTVLTNRKMDGTRIADKEKKRWPIWKKWRNFCKDTDFVNTTIQIDVPTDIETTLYWSERQYGTMFKMLDDLNELGIKIEKPEFKRENKNTKMLAKVLNYLWNRKDVSVIEKKAITERLRSNYDSLY